MKAKIFLAAAVIFSSTAVAQQSPATSGDSAKDLNEVIITANKFLNKTSLTGKVVTVISREQLEKSAGKDLAQVLTEQAGLYVNGAGSNPGKDKSLYLRGAKTEHTLITVDGVPVYDPSGIGSNFDIRLLSIDNIERIEILKGSQSTLYGSDAIAGVINIITRKTGNKPWVASGKFNYGSYNTFHGNAAIRGATNKFDYQGSYSYDRTDGINETTDTITTPHVTDKDGFKQNSLYVAAGYSPSSKIHLQTYLRFTRMKAAYDRGAFTDELDMTNTLNNLQTGIKSDWQIGKSLLQLTYNYSDVKRVYIDDSVKSNDGFYSKGDYRGAEHFAEALLVAPLSKLLKLTAGVDFRASNTSQEYNSVSIYGPYNTALGKDSAHQNQLGVYAALVLNNLHGFSAELGGRFNHHSTYGTNFVFNLNPSYLLNDQWKLFANLSSGYKTPTLYQLYSEYGNRQLKPESAINIEAGLQYFTKDKKLNARVTYFDRSVKNLITFYTAPVTYVSYYINQDKQHDKGLELDASWQIGKKAALKIFYTRLDGKLTTIVNGKDSSYFNLTRRPKNSFGASLGSDIGSHIYISSGLTVTGKRTDIGYDQYFNPLEIELKAYALWNIYAEYSFAKARLKVFADVQNITNTHYTEVYGFNALGRNASLGLRFNFSAK